MNACFMSFLSLAHTWHKPNAYFVLHGKYDSCQIPLYYKYVPKCISKKNDGLRKYILQVVSI